MLPNKALNLPRCCRAAFLAESVSSAVLFAATFWSFVGEFSPLQGIRRRTEDASAAAWVRAVKCSSNVTVFLARCTYLDCGRTASRMNERRMASDQLLIDTISSQL